MTRRLLPFPLHPGIAQAMAPALEASVGRLYWRRVPDGGSLVTIDDVRQRNAPPARGRRPVLVDDIVSSGHTGSRARGTCNSSARLPPSASPSHAVFSEDG